MGYEKLVDARDDYEAVAAGLAACCLFCEIVKFWFSRPIPREPF